ncbi:MAG: hypothetical protein ABIL09_21555, partial [Gemmatimonadota bacterium]
PYVPAKSDWVTKLESPEAARLLREAAAAERQGLVALAEVLTALGGTPPEVYMDGTYLQSGGSPSGSPATGSSGTAPTPSIGGEHRSLGADAAPPAGSVPSAPGRRVLEGVPRMASHTDRWRFTHFCHALDVSLQYLGEPEQYDRLMALSGAGLRMAWAPQMWDGGNSDPLGMARQTLEPMRRAFRGAGYQMLPVARAQADGWPQDILQAETRRLGGELTDEAGFRRRILASIDRGLPVIAFGVIGPPEATVITGYDEGGDVLIGWNEFQGHESIEKEPSGYFRVRDWYPKTHALLILGDTVGPPAPDELYRSTLLWAVEVLRNPAVGNHATGPAAFEAWAADMASDEYFPADNTGMLHARLNCHWDGMTMQAERATVLAFLEEAARHDAAMAEHLQNAAAALQTGGVLHGVAPGERDQIARLADRAVRAEVARSILATRDAYQKAADHIEAALLAAGTPDEVIPRPGPAAVALPPDPDQYLVLDGVPKVGFGMIDGHVGMTPFPACMRAILEYMGDDLGLSQGEGFDRDAVYAYLMGTTGAAFRLSWKPGWHGDNVASWMLSDDPGEIFRRGFAAAGYEQISSGHVAEEEKEKTFRRLVKEAIGGRARPLIAHGVIGPPEEALIAGYGEGGATVMGWSFFQDREIGTAGVEFLPSGYFRKRHWVPSTWGLMAFGDKVGDPPRRETYTDALKWALKVSREAVRYGERYSGQAAYTVWAEHILRDDEVAEGGGPDDAFRVHSDAIDVIAEGRHYAHVFVEQAAAELPEVEEDLLAAAACYKAEHDLMWEIWGLVGSNVPGPEQQAAFLEPEVRRNIVPLIHRARDQDVAATQHIEAALLALEVPRDEIAPPTPAELPQLPGKKGEPHILPGLEFPKWAITELGCTYACLAHQGVEISRAWLYGGTARAFLINIHEDVDVEAVTAFDRQRLLDLSPNLGFRVEGFKVGKEEAGDGYRERQREAWTFARSRVSMGIPCYGWELKPPYGDYWLITGFDDVGYYYAGWEVGGPTPWEKLGDQFIPVLDVRSVVPCESASDEAVVREAFRAALWHAENPREWTVDGDAHVGPDAFEAWAASLEEGRALLNHHAYNASAWHETREMAVAFLEEAKGRLGRADLDPLFDEAIVHYGAVRDHLATVVAKYPVPHEGWEERALVQDGEMAEVLRQAGQAERRGLAVLARIAAQLE